MQDNKVTAISAAFNGGETVTEWWNIVFEGSVSASMSFRLKISYSRNNY